MGQTGWIFDINRCIGCHACTIACATWNGTDSVFWRPVARIEQGTYPDVVIRNLSMPCRHCADAPCMQACPVKARSERASDGVVLVDQGTCVGGTLCFWACPFGVPKIGPEGKMSKCTYCDNRPDGLPRACEEVCPTKAIVSGDLEAIEPIARQRGAERVGGPARPALFLVR